MINVSSDYKEMMARPIRNRAYLSVGIGVVNQNAQENGVASGSFEYWSKGNVFNTNQSHVEYATLEENYMKADGTMLFVPENDELMQLENSGLATSDVMGAIRIDFTEVFAIKGLTLVFGSAYPTKFTVETAEKNLEYTNDTESFATNDVLGDTDYILIKPTEMVGGQQRFRLKSVLMGVGLQYSNASTKSFNHTDFVSTISEELPSESTTFSFYDEQGLFDVDDDNSFIDFLETMQQITISFGLELDDGSVEWHQIATNYLKEWKSQRGVVSITATDRLSQMEGEYNLGNKIYTRTAYEEAESIFADAGLEPDEYIIDDYLKDVTLTNPMPISSHKECLQLLANACRCIIRQNENGRILIQANFANVLDPDDLTVATNGVAEWSKPNNVLICADVVYAELAQDFLKTDGQMCFLPENESYLETAYVSGQVADSEGSFDKNLLKVTAESQTINGVTFTVNDDGSITVDGTATANAVFILASNGSGFAPENGKYILSGCPSGGGYTYDLRFWNYNGSNVSKFDTGNGAEVDFSNSGGSYNVAIVVFSGQTVNNLIFKPMIRRVDSASDFIPHQENPTLTISMPAAHTYFGVNVDFDGNMPSELIVHTYKSDALVESVKFTDLVQSSYLLHEFSSFDTMTFEFTKGYPQNRVLVNKISFGALSDYVLSRVDMMEHPIGYKEHRVKSVKVKVFTFQENNGNVEEVSDDVYVEQTVHTVGEHKILQNPLVSTQEHATLLAEWLGNYYGNNISYDVNYRGEPRINAGDIIHMESDKKSNLQVEITSNDLSFNGAFSGKLELRRALKMMGG